jgi:hypothetical protein
MSQPENPNGEAPQGGIPMVPWLPLNTQATVINVEMAKKDEEGNVNIVQMVQILLATPGGLQVHMFDPDDAINFGQLIIRNGQMAKTGLILPFSEFHPTGGDDAEG